MYELLDSVNALVQSQQAASLYETLSAVAHLARIHPLSLEGEAEILNPLLELNRRDPEAFKRVLDLVDEKRIAAGLSPLRATQESRYDKTEYMREFMDAKRQRQRRAAEIENMFRAEADRLVGRARIDFMEAQSAKWKAALDERIEKARVTHGGKRLPKLILEAIRTKFWADVDSELDEFEALARKEQLRPPHLRQRPPK